MNNAERNLLNGPAIMPMILGRRETDVALSFRIGAENNRVLNAVSIPEYIEAWLLAPDTEKFPFVFRHVAQSTFWIDLYRSHGLRASIIVSCRVVSANQIRYTWKTTYPAGTPETLVDMELLARPDGCMLGVRHCGFQDNVESAWYCKMWQRSLERLSRLIEKN